MTKYAGLVCAQAHRQELIQDLYKTWHDPIRGTVSGGMIRYTDFSSVTQALSPLGLHDFRSNINFLCRDLLISFRKATGQKPLRIIFYRFVIKDLSVNISTFSCVLSRQTPPVSIRMMQLYACTLCCSKLHFLLYIHDRWVSRHEYESMILQIYGETSRKIKHFCVGYIPKFNTRSTTHAYAIFCRPFSYTNL